MKQSTITAKRSTKHATTATTPGQFAGNYSLLSAYYTPNRIEPQRKPHYQPKNADPVPPLLVKNYIYITLSEKFYDICRLFTLSLLFVGVYVYKRVIRCIKVCAKCVSKCAFLVKTLVRLWKCLRIEFNRCFWRLSGGAYEV